VVRKFPAKSWFVRSERVQVSSADNPFDLGKFNIMSKILGIDLGTTTPAWQ
jgi:hypothetical protein